MNFFKIAVSTLFIGLVSQPSMAQNSTSQTGVTYQGMEVPEGVNSSGSFQHRLSFDIPEFRGLEPNLGISYNSSFKGLGSEEVYLGVGWRLTGFSSIERVSVGGGSPAFLDDRDVFRLDGSELLACADADAITPWPTSREYPDRYKTDAPSASCSSGGNMSTQVESYRKIERKIQSYKGRDVEYFIITQTDGTQYTYRALGALAGDGTGASADDFNLLYRRKFLLSEIRDTQKTPNIVTFEYGFDAGTTGRAHFPRFIRYADYTVEFKYDFLADPLATYAIGHPTKMGSQNKRLISVQVRNVATKIRAYDFSYEQAPITDRHRLTRVRTFGSDYVMNGGLVASGSQLPPMLHSARYTTDDAKVGTQTIKGSFLRGDEIFDIDGDNRDDVVQAGNFFSVSRDENGDLTSSTQALPRFTSYPANVPLWTHNGQQGTFYSQFARLPASPHMKGWFYYSASWTLRRNSDGVERVGNPSFFLNGLFPETGDIPTTNLGGDSAGWHVGNFDDDPETEIYNGLGVFNFNGSSFTGGFSIDKPFYFDSGRANYLTSTLVDLDGDGALEFVYPSTTDPSAPDALKNNWTVDDYWEGEKQRETINSPGALANQSDLITQADVNGDGKTDLLAYNTYNGGVTVFLSTGTGFLPGQVWLNPSQLSGLQIGHGSVATVAPVSSRDVNGDGLDDILLHSGNTLTTPSRGEEPVPTPFGSRAVSVFLSNGAAFTGKADGSAIVTVDHYIGTGDFDGNGLPDFLVEGFSNGEIVFNDGPVANLLTGFKNQLGGETRIAYGSSTDLGAGNQVPSVSQVTSSIEQLNGHGQTRRTEYRYVGSRYDYVNRRSLGFRTVTASLPTIGAEVRRPTVVTSYLNDDIGQAGKVKSRTFIHNQNGQTYSQTINNWVSEPAVNGPYRTHKRKIREKTWFGGQLIEKTKLVYDDLYGQTYITKDYGFSSDGKDLDGHDNLFSHYFFQRNLTKYIVDKPKSQYLFFGSNHNDLPKRVSGKLFSYDGQAYGIAPIQGNITRRHSWRPGTNWKVIGTSKFDNYGNAIESADAKGNKSFFEYDASKHLFQTKTINAEGFSDTTVWNAGCQQPMSQTDANGLTTTTTLDKHCRVIKEQFPNGHFKNTIYVSIGNPTAQYIRTNEPSGSSLAGSGAYNTRTYLNGFGETYKSTKTAKESAVSKAIVTRYNYDARGRMTWQSDPLTWTEGLSNATPANSKITRFWYDPLNRETQRVLSNGAQNNTFYEVRPGDGITNSNVQHPTIKTQDAHCYDASSENTICHHLVQIFDNRGNNVESRLLDNQNTDVGQTGTLRQTKYRYDLLNRLTGVTDPKGAVWAYTYDTFGNRLTADDPGLGLWTMRYDLNNNLISQTDAKGQKIDFTHDKLDRILSKKVTWKDQNNVTKSDTTTYRYNQANADLAGKKNIGQLTTIENSEHRIRFGYDASGQAVQDQHLTKKAPSRTYNAVRSFKSTGALNKEWLPTGSTGATAAGPTRVYDAGMRLHSIPGWINSIDYNSRDLPLASNFANGMKETRIYVANNRWVGEIRVRNSAGQTKEFTRYHRTIGGRVHREKGLNAPDNYSYCYDYAGRLTVAANLIAANKNCANIGSWTGTDLNDQFFSYRADGSMATNSDVGTYNYTGSPVAHAPAKINNTTLSYDANGNMTKGYDGKVMTYDGENRPLSVTKDGTKTEYVYGADGTRLKKIVTAVGSSTPKTTLYVANVEIREPATTNEKVIQYPHENIRIVDGAVSYMFRDQLGSVRLIADQNQAFEERSTYTAFGREKEAVTGNSKGVETKGWIGERFDAGAGLQYLNARYYDPDLSMFIQPDWFEVTLQGVGTNRYSYSFNDPINMSDPNGNLTVVVKGTDAKDNKGDYKKGSDYLKDIEQTFDEEPIVLPGVIENNRKSRSKAARELRKLIDRHTFKKDEDLNIVAHSHGGNAVKEYTLDPGAKKIDTLVTLATPQRSDYKHDPSKVDRFIAAYSTADMIVPKAGGTDGSVLNFFKYAHADFKNVGALNINATKHPAHDESRRGGVRTLTGHTTIRSRAIWRGYVDPEIRKGN